VEKGVWSGGAGNNLKISFKLEKIRLRSFSFRLKVISPAL
jgi:hypothetical protein